ncbi:hypothetical protein P9112_006130 [Eukaryota sp. TZLM1-RC]
MTTESHLREAFNLFDKDSNGVIDFEELRCVMSSLGYKPSEAELQTMMDSVDLDKNGVIDFSEFTALMTSSQPQDSEEDELRAAFNTFDKNSDGFISRDELQTMMEALGISLSESELSEMFETADTNSDGVISFEEFSCILED